MDLVVYGGTASGVMTAYSAAREGLRVVLLEPGAHLGGMVTGGLSATDLGHFTIIGGYARDFYLRPRSITVFRISTVQPNGYLNRMWMKTCFGRC